MKTASRQHIEDCENKVELKMVRFARHGTNEVCGVECKSAVFYGTELSNPQSSSIGECTEATFWRESVYLKPPADLAAEICK